MAEWDAELVGGDPLAWRGYAPPSPESVITGRTASYAFVEGRFDVQGGSMGAAHGERVVRAYRRAIDERLPVVAFTASGGARMQEGMVALIQMARTASAAAAHAAAGLLSVAIHRHPTTGGVFASYGSLADVRAAEPGATVGFAGPRVVELTTGEALPPNSHTAESAYAAALVDALVSRDAEAEWIEAVLGQRSLAPPTPFCPDFPVPQTDGSGAERVGEVQLARADDRATGTDVAWMLATSWVELRSADPGVRAALATIGGQRLVVIAHDRRAGAGRPGPAGFRLAQRAIGIADRLGLPLLTFIDTPGAEPGAPAEADAIAREIATTFAAMADLRSPERGGVCGRGRERRRLGVRTYRSPAHARARGVLGDRARGRGRHPRTRRGPRTRGGRATTTHVERPCRAGNRRRRRRRGHHGNRRRGERGPRRRRPGRSPASHRRGDEAVGSRMKRGTGIVVTTALFAVAAVLIVVFVLQLSSSGSAKTQIGDETFQVGDAKRLANQTPLLFQDLRGHDLNVWVNHTGTDHKVGWVTFVALVDAKCPVEWKPKTQTFVDCHKKVYPPDGGTELPHYATTVDSKGRVVVDFTQ